MRTWRFHLPATWLAAGLLFPALFQVNPLLSQPAGWLSWRGPSANGSIIDNTLNQNSFRTIGAVLWQTNVGTGHSAVAVQGNRVYTMGNREEAGDQFSDQVVCLNAETGKLIWQVTYPMKELEDPGPFSTPVVDGSRVYTISRGGKLSCFDALTEACLWENDLVTRNLTSAEAEFACSPLIVGDMVILNVNERGLALNKLTGQPVWTSAPGENAVSTSVLFTWNGRTCVTMQTDTDKTFALDPATGEVLWSVPESYTELAGKQVIEMAPTDAKGRGYRRVCACWPNPVYCDHKLYIRNSYGELVCLEVR